MTNKEKREKVIKGLKWCMNEKHDCYMEKGCPYENEGDDVGCKYALHRDALALLKAQEPRVMTLDEVVSLQEWKEDAWIEETAMPGIPSRIIAVTLTEKATEWQGNAVLWFSDEQCRYVTDYNLNTADGWRCWTSRPTDEQREAVEWDG